MERVLLRCKTSKVPKVPEAAACMWQFVRGFGPEVGAAYRSPTTQALPAPDVPVQICCCLNGLSSSLSHTPRKALRSLSLRLVRAATYGEAQVVERSIRLSFSACPSDAPLCQERSLRFACQQHVLACFSRHHHLHSRHDRYNCPPRCLRVPLPGFAA